MNYFNESKTYESETTKYDKVSAQMGSENSSCKGMEMPQCTCSMMPIVECPQERVCHRYICYDVPHIMPCNTRIINHHVYRHTYRPEYTYCEENVCENVYDRGCC